MSDDRIDAKLRALLARPEEHPDAIFTARVRKAVFAEQRMRQVRRTAWQRFAIELFASGAIVLAFALLTRAAPDALPTFDPKLAGVILLALWATVALRPASAAVRG